MATLSERRRFPPLQAKVSEAESGNVAFRHSIKVGPSSSTSEDSSTSPSSCLPPPRIPKTPKTPKSPRAQNSSEASPDYLSDPPQNNRSDAPVSNLPKIPKTPKTPRTPKTPKSPHANHFPLGRGSVEDSSQQALKNEDSRHGFFPDGKLNDGTDAQRSRNHSVSPRLHGPASHARFPPSGGQRKGCLEVPQNNIADAQRRSSRPSAPSQAYASSISIPGSSSQRRVSGSNSKQFPEPLAYDGQNNLSELETPCLQRSSTIGSKVIQEALFRAKERENKGLSVPPDPPQRRGPRPLCAFRHFDTGNNPDGPMSSDGIDPPAEDSCTESFWGAPYKQGVAEDLGLEPQLQRSLTEGFHAQVRVRSGQEGRMGAGKMDHEIGHGAGFARGGSAKERRCRDVVGIDGPDCEVMSAWGRTIKRASSNNSLCGMEDEMAQERFHSGELDRQVSVKRTLSAGLAVLAETEALGDCGEAGKYCPQGSFSSAISQRRGALGGYKEVVLVGGIASGPPRIQRCLTEGQAMSITAALAKTELSTESRTKSQELASWILAGGASPNPENESHSGSSEGTRKLKVGKAEGEVEGERASFGLLRSMTLWSSRDKGGVSRVKDGGSNAETLVKSNTVRVRRAGHPPEHQVEKSQSLTPQTSLSKNEIGNGLHEGPMRCSSGRSSRSAANSSRSRSRKVTKSKTETPKALGVVELGDSGHGQLVRAGSVSATEGDQKRRVKSMEKGQRSWSKVREKNCPSNEMTSSADTPTSVRRGVPSSRRWHGEEVPKHKAHILAGGLSSATQCYAPSTLGEGMDDEGAFPGVDDLYPSLEGKRGRRLPMHEAVAFSSSSPSCLLHSTRLPWAGSRSGSSCTSLPSPGGGGEVYAVEHGGTDGSSALEGHEMADGLQAGGHAGAAEGWSHGAVESAKAGQTLVVSSEIMEEMWKTADECTCEASPAEEQGRDWRDSALTRGGSFKWMLSAITPRTAHKIDGRSNWHVGPVDPPYSLRSLDSPGDLHEVHSARARSSRGFKPPAK